MSMCMGVYVSASVCMGIQKLSCTQTLLWFDMHVS